MHEIVESVTDGLSTWNATDSTVIMTANNSATADVIRQSRQYCIYQPGKSLLIFCTGVLNNGSNALGVTSRIGYFDESNGAYFSHVGDGSSGTTYVNLRTATGASVTSPVAQSSWNIDVMDGTGTSGVTLDITKAQIFTIDFEWLGVGRVRMGIVYGGSVYYVHQFINANTYDTTYMTRGSLPIRYQITNTATNGTGSMKMICATVISEGGFEPIGYPFSAGQEDGGQLSISNSGGPYPLVGIRLKNDTTYNLRVLCRLLNVQIISLDNTNMTYAIYHYLTPSSDPTTGGSWVDVGSHSSMQQNLYSGGGTMNTAGAHIMFRGYFSNNTDFDAQTLDRTITITSGITASPVGNTLVDYVILGVQQVGGSNSQDVAGSLQWTEFTT